MDTENNEKIEKKKLTDMQLRIVQGIAGILSAAALILSIYISGIVSQNGSQNIILQWLYVIVFIIIIFARRRVEAKFRIRLNFYNLVLIDGVLAGILIYFLMGAGSLNLGSTAIILISIGVTLVILGLGVAFPLIKYLKRKENGTLIPLRIPEPTEEEKKKAEAASSKTSYGSTGRSIADQIAEMTKELEGNGPTIKLDRTDGDSDYASQRKDIKEPKEEDYK